MYSLSHIFYAFWTNQKIKLLLGVQSVESDQNVLEYVGLTIISVDKINTMFYKN